MIPDAFQEMFDLFSEGFFFFDREIVFEDLLFVSFINEGFLFDVVQGDVGVFLKEADFAHHILRDPAGGQVADTAVFEGQTGAGDIFQGRQDIDTHGPDVFDRRPNEPQDNVDVVDHEIHHNADV